MDKLDAFTAAYIEAIYFTETGDSDQPSQEIEMSGELRDTIIAECAEWQADNAKLLAEAYERVGYDEARAGHDFWLTRNGHGAGFWCRDELKGDSLGERLSLASRRHAP